MPNGRLQLFLHHSFLLFDRFRKYEIRLHLTVDTNSIITMEEVKRFADFDLRGGAVEQLRLKQNCERLYAEIADETVKVEEFEDSVPNCQTLHSTRESSPSLQHYGTSHEHLGDSSTYVVRMKEAAK